MLPRFKGKLRTATHLAVTDPSGITNAVFLTGKKQGELIEVCISEGKFYGFTGVLLFVEPSDIKPMEDLCFQDHSSATT